MKILFIVPYTPTPIRVRSFNLIGSLARRGHQLTVATLWSSEEEKKQLQEIKTLGARVLASHLPRWRPLLNCALGLLSSTPLQALYCRSRSLRAQIEHELNSAASSSSGHYDVIHVEHLRGAYYGLELKGAPIVWDSVDCISYLFEQASRDSLSSPGRLMTRFDLDRTKRYEGWLVGQFCQILVVSSVDKSALEELATGRNSPIRVVPNGVDLTYFSPSLQPRQPDSLVITGKMSYHANATAVLHLVHQIMPHIWQKRPQAKLYIVGANPSNQIRQLATKFRNRIEVTGTVPDIRPYLWQASVAVAPLVYGAGIQNKILEALATATPVVTTPVGTRGLDTVDNEHLIVRSEPQAFAQGVLDLLEDSHLASQLASAGKHYVEVHHDWNRIVEQLEDIYQQTGACTNGQRKG